MLECPGHTYVISFLPKSSCVVIGVSLFIYLRTIIEGHEVEGKGWKACARVSGSYVCYFSIVPPEYLCVVIGVSGGSCIYQSR